MTAALVEALLAALPGLFDLVKQEMAGGTVTDAQVQAALQAAGLDEQTTLGLIAKAKAAGH